MREAEQRMKAVVDQIYKTGDTVGGVFEVVAHGVPPGLGSHITWDSRLDGKLAQAIVSLQAVKGVEIGFATEGAASFGSKVQDTIHYSGAEHKFTRGANRAGGLEGGITNGEDVVVRGCSSRFRRCGDRWRAWISILGKPWRRLMSEVMFVLCRPRAWAARRWWHWC